MFFFGSIFFFLQFPLCFPCLGFGCFILSAMENDKVILKKDS